MIKQDLLQFSLPKKKSLSSGTKSVGVGFERLFPFAPNGSAYLNPNSRRCKSLMKMRMKK
jgi:hypothetical protein